MTKQERNLLLGTARVLSEVLRDIDRSRFREDILAIDLALVPFETPGEPVKDLNSEAEPLTQGQNDARVEAAKARKRRIG